MKKFIYLTLCTLLLMCTRGYGSPSTNDPTADYQALRALYLATDGDNWIDNAGWPTAALFNANPTTPPAGFTDLSNWERVSVNAAGCVTELSLAGNNLNGTLPVEIGDFTDLISLHIPLNPLLTGNIPNEIGDLTDLQAFRVYSCNLNGSIPVTIGNLAQLTELRLHGNNLTGVVPTILGDLSNLTILSLGNNDLSGTIPPELGNLTNLEQLTLHRNQLTGNIPAEFANLSVLQFLILNSNDLTGCYDPALSVLCAQLDPVSSTNTYISDGNAFDATWEDFCNLGTAACPPPPTCAVTEIPLEETYACKVNIEYSDYETTDKAYDQILLDDDTRTIAGVSFAGGQTRLFIEELDPAGNTIRKQAYQLPGDDVSNVQIILDRQTDEYVLFYDVRVNSNRNVFFTRVDRATLTTLVRYYGPLVNDIAGASFSHEFAIEIIDDLQDRYMLVVNQQVPGEQNSYVVMVDKTLGYAYCPSFIEIAGSSRIVSHDIIETGSSINNAGCAYGTSYLLVGSVDNFAFVTGLDCNGILLNDANVFDIDGNTATTDPAKRIRYYNGSFYIAGETGTRSIPPDFISGKIWMGAFSFNDEFHAGLNWLKIYENDPEKKESLTDMVVEADRCYLTGQTGLWDVFVPMITDLVNPKAYIMEVDGEGTPVWSKEYYEDTRQTSCINDIEWYCGAIHGAGNCWDNVATPPDGVYTVENIDWYRNKTTPTGELSGETCYHDVLFAHQDVAPPINLVQNQPLGECFDPVSGNGSGQDLVCVVECCGEEPPGDICPVPDDFLLRPGDAFVTCYSDGNPNNPVAVIDNIDEVEPNFPGMFANDLSQLLTPGAMFTRNQIGGEVFGTCFDNQGDIYVTATTLYGYTGLDFAGQNGYASIVKINGSTMTIDPAFGANLAASAPLQGFANNIGSSIGINPPGLGAANPPNLQCLQTHSGLGNICYDENHDNLLVTNFEDGRIWRISRDGMVIDSYDPFMPDDGVAGFAPLGERIWGIQTHSLPTGQTEVYFGVWNNDRRNESNQMALCGGTPLNAIPQVSNEVHRVLINAAGNFNPASTLVFTLSNVPIPWYNKMNNHQPVSDIAISEDGLQIILSTRTMTGDINQINVSNSDGAHHSTLFYSARASENTLAWNPLTRFNISSQPTIGNSAGGVDFAPLQFMEDTDEGAICDRMIWATGDNLLLDPNDTMYPRVYGLQGFGTNEILNPNPVNINQSYLIDADGNIAAQAVFKTFMGDVEVFKCDCIDCQISSTLMPTIQGDSTCCYALDLANISVASQAASIQIDITNPAGVFFDQTSITTSLNLLSYNPTSLIIDNNGNLLPNGNTNDYLRFCFGNSNSTTVFNQSFTITYFDISGNELVDCEQEFTTDCELPPTDRGCVDVTAVSVECDEDNYGQFKFTYQVTNLTTDQVMDNLDFTVVNPATGIILSATSNPIVAPIGPGQTSTDQCIDIYDIPQGPYPKQVDIIFSATGYHQSDSSIFCCHDMDTLSIELPECTNCIDIVDYNVYCDSSGDYYLDFCVANNSTPPFVADELDIAKLSSIPSYLGLSQYLWNSTTDPLDFPLTGTFCETVQIIGFNPPQAGDMIELEFRLNNIAQDSCCAEREILNLTLPPCVPDECCTSFDEFDTRIAGFYTSASPDLTCEIAVTPRTLDECDRVTFFWGDGTMSGPFTMADINIPHTYPSSGTYNTCMLAEEVDENGDVCWEKQVCLPVQVTCLSWQYCDPVIDLGTTTLSSGAIHAQNEVISIGAIPAGINVSLKAGQSIRLEDGFNSDANADLEIIIEDCEPQ